MAVLAQHTAGLYYFEFDCSQWSEMDATSQADWTIIDDSCGLKTVFGNPYASSELLITLDGRIIEGDNVTVVTVDGITTISADDSNLSFSGTSSPVALNISTGTDVEFVQGVGIALSADSDTLTITNSAPDQTVVLNNGTGISVTGTYPNFTITNSLPDQVVAISPGTGISVSGTYPNFTVTNSAPDQTVSLTAGSGISITGTYPNFTIAATGGGLADGDKVDITVSGSGTVWTIDNNVVTDAKLRQSAGLSVIGRSAITAGNVADITAGTDAFVLRRSGTSLGFGQVATGGITDAAVTYAKIQNVSATSRVLGRITAGAGVVEELTAANLYTILGITGTATRPAIFTGTNTLTTSAQYTWDNTNNRLTVTGTVAGTGANNAWLNLNGGSITGTAEALRASANLSTSLDVVIANARNLSNTGNTKIEIQVGGTAAGDPFLLFTVPSGTNHVIGIDNSDADKLKITPGGTAPGSTANKGISITTDAATLVGINKDAPVYPLDVAGRARATQYIGLNGQWASGNIAFGTGAGTGPVLNGISGPCNAFNVLFTTGTAPAVNSTIFTATFPTAFPLGPTYTVFSARSATGATDYTKFFIAASSDTAITFQSNGTLPASTQYSITFFTFGN